MMSRELSNIFVDTTFSSFNISISLARGVHPSKITICLAACSCSGNESKLLALRNRVIASASPISVISINFSNPMTLPMDLFLLVIKMLPLLPGRINPATTPRETSSALSNTINHSPIMWDIHWRTDSTEPLIPEPCVAIPLNDTKMLSREEASTQKMCKKLVCENKSIVMNDTMITYLSNISSMNLRQIWVFPIPPIPQRRQERLTTILLVGQ